MEPSHRRQLSDRFAGHLRGKRVVCLAIADRYEAGDPELVAIVREKVRRHLH